MLWLLLCTFSVPWPDSGRLGMMAVVNSVGPAPPAAHPPRADRGGSRWMNLETRLNDQMLRAHCKEDVEVSEF